MEHTIKIEINITSQDIADLLAFECGGFDYWAELCSDDKEYEAAQQRLAESDMKPCCENVLTEILESGGKLTVYDREEDKDHELTVEKLLGGWRKYIEKRGSADFENYDADDADGILQYSVFDDWVYG